MDENIVSLTEAASLLGMSVDAAYNRAISGRLRATKHPSASGGNKGRWAVERAAIEEYRAAQRVYREPTIGEAAWAAGFLDGEGCFVIGVSVARQKSGHVSRSHVPHVRASNTDIRPLQFLADLFGGTVCPVTIHNPRWSPCWAWLACSQNAERVLRAVTPYLVVKKEQAGMLLELCERLSQHRAQGARTITPEEREWRQGLKERIAALNGRKAGK